MASRYIELRRKWLPRIIGPFLILLGTFVTWGSYNDWQKFGDSHAWPTALATVTVSEVKTWERKSKGKMTVRYDPNIEYEYTVDGKTHTGSRLDRNLYFDGSKEFSDTLLAQYPLGAQIPTHYNSEHPDRAIVVPVAADSGIPYDVWTGIGMALGGLALSLFGFRPREAPRP